MFSAVAPDACARSIAPAIWSPLATRRIESSTPWARAACCSASSFAGVFLTSSATRAAIRRSPGTASIRISCRLPSWSLPRRLTPVVLPSGRASELTRPDSSRSPDIVLIGMVFVACCNARIASSPPVTMASTRALTSSAAYCEIRSGCSPYARYSTARFWPSMKPRRRSSLKKATFIGASRVSGSKQPRRYIRPGSCASAANGHAALAPASAMN